MRTGGTASWPKVCAGQFNTWGWAAYHGKRPQSQGLHAWSPKNGWSYIDWLLYVCSRMLVKVLLSWCKCKSCAQTTLSIARLWWNEVTREAKNVPGHCGGQWHAVLRRHGCMPLKSIRDSLKSWTQNLFGWSLESDILQDMLGHVFLDHVLQPLNLKMLCWSLFLIVGLNWFDLFVCVLSVFDRWSSCWLIIIGHTDVIVVSLVLLLMMIDDGKHSK